MRSRVSVVIAVALALSSTSVALAESTGDGGPFDSGDFRGSGSSAGGYHRGGFDAGRYYGSGLEGGGFAFGRSWQGERGLSRRNGVGFYARYPHSH
jgi:uncharacterized membrane protein